MLTPKEIEVLRLTKKGLRQQEIANKLHISQPAVSNFYHNALKKIRDSKEILKIVRDLKLEIK